MALQYLDSSQIHRWKRTKCACVMGRTDMGVSIIERYCTYHSKSWHHGSKLLLYSRARNRMAVSGLDGKVQIQL